MVVKSNVEQQRGEVKSVNWMYFIVVFVICIPGIYFMYHSEKVHLKENDVTDKQRLTAHFLTALIFSLIGSFTVPKILVIEPVELTQILFFGLALGVICSLGHLIFYYQYLVPRITKNAYLEIESHYAATGILSRVFYGGVLEEVIFRWGLLSLLIWIFQLLGVSEVIRLGTALFISSILFAWVHLPTIKLVASEPKRAMYVYTLIGNSWVGLFTGVAFIQGGLTASILVHMLFHLLWWPIQVRERDKLMVERKQ